MAQDIELIIELLQEIQKSNLQSNESFDRLLAGINNKVDDIKNSASADLIKVYLNDLTRSVESKYNTTLTKFTDVEQALRAIFDSQDEHVKNKDIKELFDIFAENLNKFYTESLQQKTILSGIETKISEIGDKSLDKEEIIHVISLLRKDFESLNNGYNETINSVSSDLNSVLSGLMKLDQSKVTLQIQTQVEAMYKAINDIANYLSAIDKHESELETILANTATSESLKLTQVSIDSIMDKTNEVILTLSELANKSDIKDLQDAAIVINNGIETVSKKEDISEILQKADSLSEKANELKKSLAEMSKEMNKVLDKSTLEDALQNLYTHLGEIQDDIIGTNVTGNVIELDNKLNLFSDDLSVIRNIVSDLSEIITGKITTLLENISFENESYDIKTQIAKMLSQLPQKEDVDRILENQEFGKSNITYVRQSAEDLMDRLDNLPTHADMEILNSNQASLIENLQAVSTKDDVDKILSKTDDIEKMIDDLNFDNEFSQLYDKTSSIENWLKESEVREKTDEILAELLKKADGKDIAEIMKSLEAMASTIDELSENADAKKVNRTLSEVYQQIEDLKNDFTNTTEMHYDSLLVTLSGLQKSLAGIVSAGEFDNFIDDLKTFTQKLTNYTDTNNENFEQIRKSHDIILEKLNNVDTSVIEKLLDDRMQGIDERLANMSESLSNMFNNAVSDDVKHSISEIRDMLKNKMSGEEDKIGSKLSGMFEGYLNDVKTLLGHCETEFSKGIINQINKLEDLVGNYTTSGNKTLSEILEKLEKTEKAIEKTVDSGTIHSSIAEISELSERIFELGSTFKVIAQKDGDTKSSVVAVYISEKFDELSTSIKELSYQVENKLQAGFAYNSALLEEKTSALLSLIKELRHENPQNIELYERLTVADNKLSDAKQELELVNTDVKDAMSQANEVILGELSQIKSMLEQYCANDSKNIADDIKKELDEVNDGVEEIVEGSQAFDKNSIDIVQLEDSYKRISSELANNLRDFVLTDIDSLIIKLDDIKYQVEVAMDRMNPPKIEDMDEFKDFVENIADFKAHQKTLIDGAVNKLTSTVEGMFKDNNEKLLSAINLAINNENIIEAIENLKRNITDRISEAENIEKADETVGFGSNSFEKEFDSSSKQNVLTDIVSEFDSFSERLEYILGENSEFAEILTSIKAKLDGLAADNQSSDNFDNIGTGQFDIIKALDYLKEDINGLKASVEQVARANSLSVNDLSGEDLLRDVSAEILPQDEWFEKIKEYVGFDEIRSAINSINEKFDSISTPDISGIVEKFTSTENLLKLLNNKVDVIASDDFDEQVTYMLEELNEKVDNIGGSAQEIQDIKDLINSQSDYLKNVEKSDRTEILQKCLDELSLEVNNLSADSSEDIKKSVRDMKESIMAAVVTVFDQISFAEESEDIKDFVEEKTDEINQNLAEVTSRLRQITNSSEEEDYTYSMQDIESDLAKMRLALNELQETEQENSNLRLNSILENINQISSSVASLQNSVTSGGSSELQNQIDKINSDLTSLNSLTNRLIVTSGASYDVITQNLNAKVDNVAKMIEKSHESDKVVRQALVYMGEWIDSTSENMNKITTNSEEIVDIKQAIESLKNNIPEQKDILNALGEKFDEQQERLSYFEKQLTKLGSLEDRFDSQQERIDRLEMALDKVLNAVQDIDDSRISRKIDKLDKQIIKLSTYVEKLAQYVE